MNKLLIILSSLLILGTSVSVLAGEKIMYKWTDEKGEVHYSERAPKGIEYTRIRTYVDSSKAASSPAPKLPEKQTKLENKKDSYGTWREENCTIATQNLEMLQNAGRIGVDDGQGGKRLMTDEEKAEKIAQMKEQQEKYCSKSNDNGS